MRRLINCLIVGTTLLPLPALVGCDRTVDDKKTVDTKVDGSTVTKESKTTQDPNTGAMTKTETKDVSK